MNCALVMVATGVAVVCCAVRTGFPGPWVLSPPPPPPQPAVMEVQTSTATSGHVQALAEVDPLMAQTIHAQGRLCNNMIPLPSTRHFRHPLQPAA